MSDTPTAPTSIRCRFGIHDWDAWALYELTMMGGGKKLRQFRECKRCGRTERDYV